MQWNNTVRSTTLSCSVNLSLCLYLWVCLSVDTEGCDHGWKKFHGHCYKLFTRRHTWEDAEKDCRELSGHLTSVTSSMEQDFLNGESVQKAFYLLLLWFNVWVCDAAFSLEKNNKSNVTFEASILLVIACRFFGLLRWLMVANMLIAIWQDWAMIMYGLGWMTEQWRKISNGLTTWTWWVLPERASAFNFSRIYSVESDWTWTMLTSQSDLSWVILTN